jgi:hypothetical protein
MSYTLVAKRKRLRGAILELLCTNHDKQESRFNSSALWSALVRGLGFEASKYEVFTMLQDLQARGYITYQLDQKRKDLDGEIRINNIELCPKGRDILEGTSEDPAVEI